MTAFNQPRSLARRFSAVLFAASAILAAAQGVTSAGIQWTVPAGWTEQPPRQMRLATYVVPAAKGAEAGECGVFYFGKGQGGTLEENISRWGAQFEGSPAPVTSVETVAGMKVHRAQTSGTYLAPAGPMMQSSGKKPGYRLLGAIVEAPDGLVFFKCTGPAPTIAAGERGFEGMVKSIRKAPAAKF